MTKISQRVFGPATDGHLGSFEMEQTTIASEFLRAKVLNFGGILNALEVKKDNGRCDSSIQKRDTLFQSGWTL